MPISRRQPPPDSPELTEDLLDLPLAGDAVEEDPEPRLRRASGHGGAGPFERRPPRRRRRGGGLWLVLLLAFPIGALAGYFLSSDPPIAELSTDQLDFSEIRLGAPSQAQEVGITNRGEQALWITATILEGEAAEDFRLVVDDCVGVEVPTEAGCSVRLAFAPAVRGARRARVRFDSNAEGGPSTVPLIGVGVMPELSIEPRALDLGRQTVGSAGPPAVLRLDNRGTAPLRLGRLEVVGAAAKDFRRVADDCSGQQLAPGGSCTARYRFSPTAAGDRRASLQVRSDASEEPSTIPLSGFAVALEPILRLVPERIEFGDLGVGETSSARTLRLANDGNGPLRVRGLRLTELRDVAAGGAFELAAAPCAGKTVPPGRACEVEIRFRPVEETAARTVLEVDSSASAEPARLSVSGRGTAPHIAVDPQRVSFGEIVVQALAPARALTLSNNGTGELEIHDVEVTGADARAFDVEGCRRVVLTPGGACRIEVRFRPRRVGPHRAQLVLNHTADRKRHELPLNGLGVTARLTLDRDRLDFGEVAVGRSERQRLVLKSSGRGALEIRRLRLTGGRDAGFVIDGDTCSGAKLAPSAVCAVEIVFRPTGSGSRRVQLAIEHNADERAVEVPIFAAAVP